METRTLILLSLSALSLPAQPLAVRGLHMPAPRPDDMPLALRFISDALPKEGVNLLVLELNYGYQFARHPEIASDNALSREQLLQIADACKKANVQLVPMINLLGHQSWAKTTFKLLQAYPDFDETPGKYPGNEGIYCRSYCPLHPKVHDVVFDLIDELMDVTGAKAFHAGMDEVFLIGEDDCPRCRGKNKAELFAGEVKAVRDHLAAQGRELWIWGDRLIDGDLTGIGKWEASQNQTAPAIHLIPKDVVIADWHYESAHPTIATFAMEGFRVVASPWRKPRVAMRQIDLIRHMQANAAPAVSARLLGVLQTTWVGFGAFVKAYYNEGDLRQQPAEAALCFREVMRELRARQ
jgi:hypothetical protein